MNRRFWWVLSLLVVVCIFSVGLSGSSASATGFFAPDPVVPTPTSPSSLDTSRPGLPAESLPGPIGSPSAGVPTLAPEPDRIGAGLAVDDDSDSSIYQVWSTSGGWSKANPITQATVFFASLFYAGFKMIVDFSFVLLNVLVLSLRLMDVVAVAFVGAAVSIRQLLDFWGVREWAALAATGWFVYAYAKGRFAKGISQFLLRICAISLVFALTPESVMYWSVNAARAAATSVVEGLATGKISDSGAISSDRLDERDVSGGLKKVLDARRESLLLTGLQGMNFGEVLPKECSAEHLKILKKRHAADSTDNWDELRAVPACAKFAKETNIGFDAVAFGLLLLLLGLLFLVIVVLLSLPSLIGQVSGCAGLLFASVVGLALIVAGQFWGRVLSKSWRLFAGFLAVIVVAIQLALWLLVPLDLGLSGVSPAFMLAASVLSLAGIVVLYRVVFTGTPIVDAVKPLSGAKFTVASAAGLSRRRDIFREFGNSRRGRSGAYEGGIDERDEESGSEKLTWREKLLAKRHWVDVDENRSMDDDGDAVSRKSGDSSQSANGLGKSGWNTEPERSEVSEEIPRVVEQIPIVFSQRRIDSNIDGRPLVPSDDLLEEQPGPRRLVSPESVGDQRARTSRDVPDDLGVVAGDRRFEAFTSDGRGIRTNLRDPSWIRLELDGLRDAEPVETARVVVVPGVGYGGRDGRDGVDGPDGRDGVDGRDGFYGVDGRDGRDGRDGMQGSRRSIARFESGVGDLRSDRRSYLYPELPQDSFSPIVENESVGGVSTEDRSGWVSE